MRVSTLCWALSIELVELDEGECNVSETGYVSFIRCKEKITSSLGIVIDTGSL
jgi:hypothetical protein